MQGAGDPGVRWVVVGVAVRGEDTVVVSASPSPSLWIDTEKVLLLATVRDTASRRCIFLGRRAVPVFLRFTQAILTGSAIRGGESCSSLLESVSWVPPRRGRWHVRRSCLSRSPQPEGYAVLCVSSPPLSLTMGSASLGVGESEAGDAARLLLLLNSLKKRG